MRIHPMTLDNFDNFQKKFLKPLVKKKAVVYFPFFANTFPLGYHYYQLNPKNVKLHDWGREAIPSGLEDIIAKRNNQLFVFYATEKTIRHFKKKFKPKENNLLFNYKFISEYLPKRFFFHTYRHIALRRVIEYSRNENKDLSAFLKDISDTLDIIEIYTDIPVQAKILQSKFKQILSDKEINIIEGWEDYFKFPDPSKRVFRVYFYGAPITSALNKRKEEFTYVPFPEVKDKSEFYTYICAGKIKDSNVSEEEEQLLHIILQNLSDYHENMFRSANNKFIDLRNVWWTYNRFALSHQHNSLFKSPKDYANSLIFHHNPTKPTVEV